MHHVRMEVVSLGPLPLGALFWQSRPNEWQVSVAVKATFELLPGESRLHPTQEPIEEEDRYWDDNPRKSLYAPCDLVPDKPRVDVLLVGQAFTREPLSALVARLVVGSVDKAVEVVRTRAFDPEGKLMMGHPWFARPLGYEHAGGGPGTDNPAGVAPGSRDPRGRFRVPHLQPPGFRPSWPNIAVPPIGFGPIAPTWPSRAAHLGANALTFPWGAFRTMPLPGDLDHAYFNTAPPDQQIDALPADGAIVLQNLSAEHRHLATRLPGLHPVAFLRRPEEQPRQLPMRADTLWIDTDRSIATVVWRGSARIAHPAEMSRIVVVPETAGEKLVWADVLRRADLPPPAGITRRFDAEELKHLWGPLDFAYPDARPDGDAGKRGAPTLPFTPLKALQAMSGYRVKSDPPAGASQPDPGVITLHPDLVIEDAPAPNDTAAGRPPPEETAPAALQDQNAYSNQSSPVDTFTLQRDQVFPPALPFEPGPPELRSPHGSPVISAESASLESSPSVPTKPPLLAYRAPLESLMDDRLLPFVPPPLPDVAAPPLVPTPVPDMASRPAPAPALDAAPSGGESVGERAVRARIAPGVPQGPTASSEKPAARAGRRRMGAPNIVAAEGSALAFSNAAADPVPDRPALPVSAPSPTNAEAEPIELLWFDPELPARLQRDPAMKKHLTKGKPGSAEQDKSDRGRQDVLSVLRRSPSLELQALPEALRAAVDDGVFKPPLLVVSGEMEMLFDEVESLRAALAAVAPFVSGDPKLQEAADVARTILETPSFRTAEAQIKRLRDIFLATKRALPESYFDASVEGAVLPQRGYQKRVMFGGEMVRAQLFDAPDRPPVVTYLPEAAARELPLMRRFPVKLIAEGRRRVEAGVEMALRVWGCAAR